MEVTNTVLLRHAPLHPSHDGVYANVMLKHISKEIKDMTSKKEIPHIELYLYSMNQEFPVGKGHASFLQRNSEVMQDISGKLISKETVAEHIYTENFEDIANSIANDWSAQWIHNKWIQDYTKSPSWSNGMRFGYDRIRDLVMREEDFGGIVLDPHTDRVFKVNQAGYRVLTEMQQASKKGTAAKMKFTDHSSKETESFVAFLRGAGLWA